MYREREIIQKNLRRVKWYDYILAVLDSPTDPHLNTDYLRIMLDMHLHGCYCFIWDNMEEQKDVSIMKFLLKLGFIEDKNSWSTQLGSYEYICALTSLGEEYICSIIQNGFHKIQKQDHEDYESTVRHDREHHHNEMWAIGSLSVISSMLVVVISLFMHNIMFAIAPLVIIWWGFIFYKHNYQDPLEPNYNNINNIQDDMFFTFDEQNSISTPENNESSATINHLGLRALWHEALEFSANADDTTGDAKEYQRTFLLSQHFKKAPQASKKFFVLWLYSKQYQIPSDRYDYTKYFLDNAMFPLYDKSDYVIV